MDPGDDFALSHAAWPRLPFLDWFTSGSRPNHAGAFELIGKTLGHYEILGALGKGGMGEVYRARDTKLGRDVAIKVLPREMSGDPERVARFEREARLLASLQHANIASIYGFEHDGGVRFLAMELVEG
ncbi:MAG: protein kinase, partial [Gammaproteobacteria bacterium]|nr:protein kinase [Gammaproteobacteria bacterium]